MPDAPFELTAHAALAIAERDIELKWIEKALSTPDRIEPHRFDPSLRQALLLVPERGDRVLRVVYNPVHKPPKVITVFFDRRQRGKL